MTKFESELKKGVFVISECKECKRIVWPASDFCNDCFSEVNWREINPVGKLIEFSKKGEKYFGLVELEEVVKVMGVLDIENNTIKLGQRVKLDSCNYKESPSFTFTKCD